MKAFKTKGTCASEIVFDLDGKKVRSVRFIGGCMGHAIGVARLVEGMDIEDVIQRLEGISCGRKGTSCPDQLAKALKEEWEKTPPMTLIKDAS